MLILVIQLVEHEAPPPSPQLPHPTRNKRSVLYSPPRPNPRWSIEAEQNPGRFILTPHAPTTTTAVATQLDHQRGWLPPKDLGASRRVHSVTCCPLPPHRRHQPSGLDQLTLQHYTLGLDELAGDLQIKVAQANEGGQIKIPKGSIGHVGVFQIDPLIIPIIKTPRPSTGHNAPPR